MKKIVFVLLSAVLVFSGCVTGNRMSRIYDKSYDYDKLYSSTLLALTSMHYKVTQDGSEPGVVHAVEDFGLYTAFAWGVFQLLPFPYITMRQPSITITLAKAVKGTMYDITESTSSMLGNRIYTLLDKVEENYSIASGKTDPEYTLEKIKGSVNTSPFGTNARNDNNCDWKDVVLNVTIGTIEGPKNFTGKIKVIYGGQTVPVDFSALTCTEKPELTAIGRAYNYNLTCEVNGIKSTLAGNWIAIKKHNIEKDEDPEELPKPNKKTFN